MYAKLQALSDSIGEELIGSAKLSGMPEKAFFKSFTPQRRKEVVYNVEAEIGGFEVKLEVMGKDLHRVRVKMPCVTMEDGKVEFMADESILSWAHSGKRFELSDFLEEEDLQNYPCPHHVMSTFMRAITTHRQASGIGGFSQWSCAVQLLTQKISRENDCAVEVTVLLPFEHSLDCREGISEVEVQDISDVENPRLIKGYEKDFLEIEKSLKPQAANYLVVPPGYVIRQRHREIFTAG
jgi:hypothetical protein